MEINNLLSESFEKWLKTLGYAEKTVKTSACYIRAFFFYLKNSGKSALEEIKPCDMKAYHRHLQERSRKNRAGGLAVCTINGHIGALKRFSCYLQLTGKGVLEIDLQPAVVLPQQIQTLSKQETRQMYKACTDDIFGTRDRAMLGVYYGCGLRRSEGRDLNVQDVLLKKNLLHVRKGKNNKERYVPMAESIKEDLEYYILAARQEIPGNKNTQNQALFLSMQGNRLHGDVILERIKKLAARAGIDKNIGLHTLRHTIATHLLQSGMDLEDISLFLGHSNPESTQIYTHLVYEEENGISL